MGRNEIEHFCGNARVSRGDVAPLEIRVADGVTKDPVLSGCQRILSSMENEPFAR
jgi:hypothetical protein